MSITRETGLLPALFELLAPVARSVRHDCTKATVTTCFFRADIALRRFLHTTMTVVSRRVGIRIESNRRRIRCNIRCSVLSANLSRPAHHP